MKTIGHGSSTFLTVAVAAVVLATATTGGAVAGSLVTSKTIKNNTIKSIDVRDNTLRSVDLQDGAVTGVDVADGSLTGGDVANGSLTQRDFASAPIGVVRGYLFSWELDPTLHEVVDLTSRDFVYNSAGGSVTLTRTAVGRYRVSFAGLDMSAGNVQVTTHGSSAAVWCKVLSWGGHEADVICVDTTGATADSYFTLAFTR